MIHGSGLDVIKFVLAIVMLLAFAVIGVACLFYPEWGMRHFGRSQMGGGELRREWNRMGMSIAGLTFAGFALYGLYVVLLK